MATRLILLGPQRGAPIVRDAVEALGVPAGTRIAAITAGWEEREVEDVELKGHLGRDVVNLHIYQRADDVYARDHELHEAMRARHDTLRELQELYRLRLARALDAARELLASDGDARLLDPEREAAIEAVREIDRHHLQRVAGMHAAFDQRWRPHEREHVARHRRELTQLLEGAGALCIAGGHVAILLNRMRLFGLMELVGATPIIGWSGGAMVLAEKLVLFHDSPPQGSGDAEVLVPALAACRGVVPLPHASARLRLEDRTRVALLARRFAGELCAALDERCRIDWDGARWSGGAPARRLCEDGSVAEIGAAP